MNNSSSSVGRRIALNLSLKHILCTPEIHHEAYQSPVPAVLQTVENDQVLLGKVATLAQTTSQPFKLR
ncbi:hypothetical protein J6590_083010 [Homalodisca vitripennis]|nr:hypothetical protein J6590_083010 [Homalodisca vitripennis]